MILVARELHFVTDRQKRKDYHYGKIFDFRFCR